MDDVLMEIVKDRVDEKVNARVQQTTVSHINDITPLGRVPTASGSAGDQPHGYKTKHLGEHTGRTGHLARFVGFCTP